MLRKHLPLALVCVFAVATAVRAQDEVELIWKFADKDGKIDKTPFYQTMSVTTQQTMTVTGEPVKQTQAQTFIFKWTPEKKEKDKDDVTLTQEIIGLKMHLQIGETEIDYDSQDAKKDGGSLKDFFKALLQAKFNVTLDPKGVAEDKEKKIDAKDPKIVEIGGRDDLVKALTKQNPQMRDLLTIVLSDAALREMVAPTFLSIPGVKKKKGDEWTRDVTLNMGAIGKYTTKYTYKYEGKDEKDKEKDRISVKIDVQYEKPAAAAGSQLPFVIQEASLKSTEGTGHILFDAKTGRVTEQEHKLTIKGDLKIEIGGQVTKITLDQNQEVKMTIGAENPIKENK